MNFNRKQLIALSLLVVGLLFWFSRYHYTRVGEIPVRTSRFTGKAEVFNPETGQWESQLTRPAAQTRTLEFERLPQEQLHLIEIQAKPAYSFRTGGSSALKLNLYNGTKRTVEGVKVRVTFGGNTATRELIVETQIQPMGTAFPEVEVGIDLQSLFRRCELVSAVVRKDATVK